MKTGSKKIILPFVICLILIAGLPKEARAQVLEGALIGAGIGAVVGLIIHIVQKKPVEENALNSNSAPQDSVLNARISDSLQIKTK